MSTLVDFKQIKNWAKRLIDHGITDVFIDSSTNTITIGDKSLTVASKDEFDSIVFELRGLIETNSSDIDTVRLLANRAQDSADAAGINASSALAKAVLTETIANEARDTAIAAKGTADSASKTATRAETTANNISGIAEGARTIADAANVAATSANETATRAETTANAISSIAEEAKATANAANETSSTANTNASTALEKANSVEGIANGAREVADAASNTATEAQATANAMDGRVTALENATVPTNKLEDKSVTHVKLSQDLQDKIADVDVNAADISALEAEQVTQNNKISALETSQVTQDTKIAALESGTVPTQEITFKNAAGAEVNHLKCYDDGHLEVVDGIYGYNRTNTVMSNGLTVDTDGQWCVGGGAKLALQQVNSNILTTGTSFNFIGEEYPGFDGGAEVIFINNIGRRHRAGIPELTYIFWNGQGENPSLSGLGWIHSRSTITEQGTNFMKFGNGFVLQWGHAVTAGGAEVGVYVTFPKPFINTAYTVTFNTGEASKDYLACVKNKSTTGCLLTTWGGSNCYWFAIGYC